MWRKWQVQMSFLIIGQFNFHPLTTLLTNRHQCYYLNVCLHALCYLMWMEVEGWVAQRGWKTLLCSSLELIDDPGSFYLFPIKSFSLLRSNDSTVRVRQAGNRDSISDGTHCWLTEWCGWINNKTESIISKGNVYKNTFDLWSIPMTRAGLCTALGHID